ncbi:MAG: hypothetical protein ISS89_05170 [Candidatus Omnitrophica bacterium]|nr:hypothetical protein [Candidatus Omnitrophota bacterium]
MEKLEKLTKDKLISLYINERKSLADIAKLYGVSRVAVYKKLKKCGIKQRSKSEARLEAQKQGKLQGLGMPKRVIYCQNDRRNPYYSIVYGHKDCEKLFKIMYKNAPGRLFLERKYNRFLEGLRSVSVGGRDNG